MNSRLKKLALMPTQMFQSQLDQISDKGRDVLKAIEEYKFFVEQTSRVMKNDPALTEVIIGKKKNLEEASTKIYDIVFDIENLDISSLYDRQQELTNHEENKNQVQNNTSDESEEEKTDNKVEEKENKDDVKKDEKDKKNNKDLKEDTEK